MRRVPIPTFRVKVLISDGKTARSLKPYAVNANVDQLNDELVVEILSPDLLAALDYLAQPEIAKAPSLDSVVRRWVK